MPATNDRGRMDDYVPTGPLAGDIQQKLDEIKNAEKQVKMTNRELSNLRKKADKAKDWKHLSKLYKQCDDDKRSI